MVFLTRISTAYLLKTGKPFVRATASFGTSYSHRKTVVESVKDQVKEVNQTVADKIVDGINASRKL